MLQLINKLKVASFIMNCRVSFVLLKFRFLKNLNLKEIRKKLRKVLKLKYLQKKVILLLLEH